MRVVLDTNVMVSALLAQRTAPWHVVRFWSERRFVVLTCERQVQELGQTFRKPQLSVRIAPARAGRMVNNLRQAAQWTDPLPFVRRSADPEDDFLLATAQAGRAEYLVTGDKGGLLALGTHEGTRIVTARQFVDLLG